MKPGFALLLSRDGIGLLQRSGDGWLAVDEISLDDPDLTPKLETLRITAEVLAKEAGDSAVLTKLILPNSEILYEEVVLPKAEDTEIGIERHLDGRTPYSVNELNYDYVVSDGLAQVAVIARETLDEAEEFATESGFNPICLCALPPVGSFMGEPMFGLTKSARRLLPQGSTVERGDGTLNVLGAVDLPELPEISPPAKEPIKDIALVEPVPVFRSSRAQSPNALAERPKAAVATVPSRLALKPSNSNFRASAAPSQALKGAFSDVRHLLSLRPIPTAVAAGVVLCAAVAWITLSPSGSDDIADGSGRITEPDVALPAPAAPEQTVPGLAGYSPLYAPVPQPAAAELPLLADAARLVAILPSPPKQPSGLGPPPSGAPVFQPATNDIAEGTLPVAEISAVVPSVSSSSAALAQVASSSPELSAITDLPPAVLPVGPTAEARTATLQEVPGTRSLGDAPVTSADTPALAQPAPAPVESDDRIPVVAMAGADPELPRDAGTVDTLAMLTQPVLDVESGARKPSLSIESNLDARPVTGMPPIAPSELLDEPAETEVVLVTTLSTEQLAQLAEVRPNARPEGLSPPQVEVADLTDPALARLQALRPSARPSGLKPPKPAIQVAVNDASDVPLAQRPKKRPSKISQMAAQKTPQAAPKTQQTAAAAAIVAPQEKPSRRRETSTVARRATMQNALSTSTVALIGVYGSESKRRALVRLPSGRYVKVNVGDRIDGGKVAAISRNSINYVKGGRSKTLKVPEG